MVLNPAEIMAQQGSSPSWLRALPGRIMTTTMSVRARASTLPISLAARDNDLRTMPLLLWVREHLLYLVLQIACCRCTLLQQRVPVSEPRRFLPQLRCKHLGHVGLGLKVRHLRLYRKHRPG